MAYTKTRVRLFWGALDVESETAKYPTYGATQYVSLGEDASMGAGVGVRRATLLLDRTLATIADDASEMHFDFLNNTADAPDDTWTAADYATLETALQAWWTTVKIYVPTDTRLSRILWNRTGPGIPKPNPAERITDITPVPGTATRACAPQCASAISLRHPIRRSWGRTYLPIGAAAASNGRMSTSDADTMVAGTVTLFNAAKAADFAPVIVSKTLNSALLIENVTCDTTIDIIRRRRWKHRAYQKSTNL